MENRLHSQRKEFTVFRAAACHLVWRKGAFVAEMTMCNRIVLRERYMNHDVAHDLETRGAAPFFCEVAKQKGAGAWVHDWIKEVHLWITDRQQRGLGRHYEHPDAVA
jgi:hypothetical protein